MYKSIVDAVSYHARKTPDRRAIVDETGEYSYGRLWELVKSAAGQLAPKVLSGQKVVVECTQDALFLAANLACEYIGAVFVPVEKDVRESRLCEIYQETGAILLISERNFSFPCNIADYHTIFTGGKEVVPPAETASDDSSVAEILYSTGTTGKPKGVQLSNRANIAVAENIIFGTGMEKDAVELVPLPLSHSHGLRTCYAHLLNGSTVVLTQGVLNIGIYFRQIEKYSVNALDLTPTMAKVLLRIARDGLAKYAPQIRYIELGTAVLEEDVKEQLKAIFDRTHIFNFYGSTEAGRSCIFDIHEEDIPGCIGYPAKHASIVITNDKREIIESSKTEMGLLAVSGEMMMDGYYNSPDLTRSVLNNGLLFTSDLGYIDDKGRVFVVGRADDVINYRGIKIAPEEIESVVRMFEGIRDCACVAVTDGMSGQAPKLFIEVSRKETFRMEDLKEFLKNNLEYQRIPQLYEIIDKIPRSSNGKILRAELRNKN